MTEMLFISLVRKAIDTTAISRNLETRAAIVHQTFAKGAGWSAWYSCKNQSDLQDVECRLRPGSEVSFFFDGRMKEIAFGSEAIGEILSIAKPAVEIVLLYSLPGDGAVELRHQLVCGPRDIEFVNNDIELGSRIYYGEDRSGENDGENAVTLIMPDRDGVVRVHPY